MKHLAIKENFLFLKAYKKGKKIVSKRIVVYLLKDARSESFKKMNPENEYINRVGFTVSKKYGHAFERNRIKRLMREAYRNIEKNGVINKGYLIIFCARDNSKGSKMQDVLADMNYSLKKLEIIE